MAEKYTVTNGGYKVEFTSYKEEVLAKMEEAITLWLSSVGSDAASTAKTEGVCPVKTCNRRDAIDWNIHADNRGVDVGTNVFYGKYQEFGTMNGVPARHFIQYGVTAHVEEYAHWLELQAQNAGF